MASNKGKDTKPELLLRSSLHAMGYRFRIHGKGLPGTPDIVFAGRRKAVWVHGCFWHSHEGCRFATVPKTRADYWVPKLARNRERDAGHAAALNGMDWDSHVVWECELADIQTVRFRLADFLGPTRMNRARVTDQTG
jgi:DNA mismatch endonuclease (patch repair protein)